MKSPLRIYPSLLLSIGLLLNANSLGAVPLARFSSIDVHELPGASCSASFSMITWHPVEVECPVCKAKNIFLQWGSYGSYIYQDPSKYQLVFWPYTDGAAWYSCKKCRYTSYMEDFKNPALEKLPELRKLLKTVTLPAQKNRSDKESMEHPPYLEIPTADRLIVAAKVYQTLGRTGDDFWNHFYRVMGFHFERAKRQDEADEARRKSLAITERFLADQSDSAIPRKELLYIAGAMKHFLRDEAGALKSFEEASSLTYSNKNFSEEQNKNADNYLSVLIKEYLDMIQKGKSPAN